ncbi:MAG: transposase [Bacteroidota bacterium]
MVATIPYKDDTKNKMNNNHPERKRTRLRGYDYSAAGCYFVTVCTQNRIECLCTIENELVVLNEYGEIVKEQWLWLEQQYDYVQLDEWIIMPNHFHGIIVIKSNDDVGNGRDRSLQSQTPQKKIKPLSEIIGAFKTTSSKRIHLSGLFEFRWQKSFYDHIVRNEESLNKIREYIIRNPIKWEMEKNNPENILM